MSIKDMAQGRSDIYRLDPKQLNVRPNWNGRDFNDAANEEHVDTLAQSISEIGVKEPLTVIWEDGKIWIVDGECRLRATLRAISHYKADIKTVPCKVEKYANDADLIMSQIVRNAGKPFTAMENARVYKRLLDMGWSQADIAKKAGISAARISQVLDLLQMPEAVKALVNTGKISASLASKTVTEQGSVKAASAISLAVAAAKAEGKARVLPKHIAAAPIKEDIKAPTTPTTPTTPTSKASALTTVKDAFETAEIDNSGDKLVVVTFTSSQFDRIRNALKL